VKIASYVIRRIVAAKVFFARSIRRVGRSVPRGWVFSGVGCVFRMECALVAK
jgi:hypothetical protein